MGLNDIRSVLARRWWVILLAIIVAELATGAYVARAQRIYQATATALIHPTNTTNQTSTSSNIQMLAYSTFTATFTSLAQSKSLLAQAPAAINVDPATLSSYTVSASTLPGSTELEIIVSGPNPTEAASLANYVVSQLAAVAKQYYPVYSLTEWDTAVPSRSPVSPKVSKDLLYAAVVGLILGGVLAALTLGNAPQTESNIRSLPLNRDRGLVTNLSR